MTPTPSTPTIPLILDLYQTRVERRACENSGFYAKIAWRLKKPRGGESCNRNCEPLLDNFFNIPPDCTHVQLLFSPHPLHEGAPCLVGHSLKTAWCGEKITFSTMLEEGRHPYHITITANQIKEKIIFRQFKKAFPEIPELLFIACDLIT